MDIIFDIDGTLANAEHRLHFINDMQHWAQLEGKLPRPNWEKFLSTEEIAKDTAIPQTWEILANLLYGGNRVIFITGRPERQRLTTYDWLRDIECEHRAIAADLMRRKHGTILYMRGDNDRRASSIVKEESLMRARADGFNPTLVFEDRADDTAMWRRNGLLCCQVAEGNY